jgi:predicted CXXCH cytochrome family protein
VETGNCTGCHNPHAASYPKLLKASEEKLCEICHTQPGAGVKAASPERVHAPVREGQCRSCHGGHEGVRPGLLNKSVPGLCADCHPGEAKSSQGPGAHAPAKEGNCKACHDPHVGAEKNLLAGPLGEVCGTCHDVATPQFKAKHGGFEIRKGACTTCHDPHGSDKGHLSLAYSHPPYGEKDCSSCHEPDGTRTAEGAALCVVCHDDHAGDGEKPVVHPAVVEGRACLNCHSPHAGKTESLLIRENLAQTCRSCHDRAMFEKPVKHGEQDCLTCHDPHGSTNRGLLVEDQETLCLGCHEAVPGTHFHPIGGTAIDPRTGTPVVCSSCHNPHSSDYPSLLTHDKAQALCLQCHSGENMEVRKTVKK